MRGDDRRGITFRLIEERDVEAAVDLMEASGQVIAGMRTRAAYRALCRDALSDRRVVVLLADAGGTLAGYGVCFIDWRRYHRSYALRHPSAAARLLCERVFARVPRRGAGDTRRRTRLPAPPGVRPAGASGRSWKESSPAIAKIAEIFVVERFRGRGLGERTLRVLFAELARRGVARVDCRTDIRNTSSLRMNEKVGLDMETTGLNSLFGTRDIVDDDLEGDGTDDHV